MDLLLIPKDVATTMMCAVSESVCKRTSSDYYLNCSANIVKFFYTTK